MKMINPVDAARIDLLADLRLPAIKLMWIKLAEQSDKEGWPAARFLAALAEHEIADRGRRRIERHLAEARLPVGQNVRQLRLRGRADGQQSASDGRRPRCAARRACNRSWPMPWRAPEQSRVISRAAPAMTR
jgi:DNA replication protein DnaC